MGDFNETSFFCIVISRFTCSLQLKRNTSVLSTIPAAPASRNYRLWYVRELCGEQHDAAAPPHCLLFSSCTWYLYALGAGVLLMPGRGTEDWPGQMVLNESYNNQEAPTCNGMRVTQNCPSESKFWQSHIADESVF